MIAATKSIDIISKGVGKQGSEEVRATAGIGYIIIPSNVDYKQYVDTCFRTGTVSMITDNNEYYHSVNINIGVLDYISFPSSIDTLGTAVLWINLPKYNKPIIVAVLTKTDEIVTQFDDKSFDLTKFHNSTVVQVVGKADQALLNVQVTSDDKAAQLHIKATSKNKDSVVRIFSDNEIAFESSKVMNVTVGETLTTKVGEKIETIYKDGELTFKGEKLNFGNENYQPALLGDTMVSMLEEFNQLLIDMTIPTSIGPQKAVNLIQFQEFKKKWKSAKSKKNNLE